ncbi:unnamed protein product [Bursaphelenchus okinawaensis]|uniref:Neurotransmitter-gated ion-channel ligand-binding domain-containing protein n=1 Tax=Bursaphelenchus okinawaensis TaxID=465554 RepID=A0A811L989_9BILA|nr:unnamed protein product [Bursaphelenchus okinawaensis]CAG9121399.1 unnamed protein product [Bursaphelenchus okinawaensis]
MELILPILLLILTYVNICYCGRPTTNRQLEKTLLAKYERRHRPVKKESTSTTVKAFIVINHIEEVNQDEQTMIVHGMLWAQWKDEYLTWDPKKWSNVDMISIQPWKIWQPAFALYNSAKTNSWYLYMNGQPATVTSNGKVSAIGAFTFHVTCSFDFSNFPYDTQDCPIVIADWVYDLSKVNLTNSGVLPKPVIRLSTNPFRGTAKKHVAGGF